MNDDELHVTGVGGFLSQVRPQELVQLGVERLLTGACADIPILPGTYNVN